jgi:peptide/nickel transport system substrate-binding protein
MGPVLEKQLKDGGFAATFVLHDPDAGPLFDKVRTGKADMWVLVHCGSSNEPWGTLQHYHSKFSAPSQGEMNSYIWGNSHYKNPEYDELINQMDGIPGTVNDPAYMALADQALELFLSDVIEITLAEERHVVTFNTAHWKGFASENDPYVAPYSLWAAFILEVLNVTKAK